MKAEQAEALVSKYNIAEAQRESDKKALQSFFQNKNIPIEQRRGIFRVTPSCLQTDDGFLFHPPKYEKKYGEVFWSDDFYIERREHVHIDSILDAISDMLDLCDEEMDERIALMEEDFIDAGIHGFTFDW